MKNYVLCMIMLGILTLISACGQTASEQAPSTSVEPEPVETAPAQTEEIVDEETNKLVIYTSGPGGMAEKLKIAFEEETNIEVEMYQATTGKVLGRLEAEQNNPLADVVVLASLPPALDYIERDLVLPYKSQYADQMRDGWYDQNYSYYGFAGSALGLSYNTNLIQDIPTDWSDLLDPQYKDQLAIPNPLESGTARDFVSAYIQQEGEAGWEFFNALTNNGLSLEGSNNPALQSVISGANQVVMAGVDYMVYSNKAKGEPVDIVFPKTGTTITPRPAFILKSSVNIASAKKYIDFILSEKGQQIVADAYLIPGREDIDAHPDRLGADDIALLQFDWGYLEENGQDILEKFTKMVK